MSEDTLLDTVRWAIQKPAMRMNQNFFELVNGIEDPPHLIPSSSGVKKVRKYVCKLLYADLRTAHRYVVDEELSETIQKLDERLSERERNHSFFNAIPPFDHMWLEMILGRDQRGPNRVGFLIRKEPLQLHQYGFGRWQDGKMMRNHMYAENAQDMRALFERDSKEPMYIAHAFFQHSGSEKIQISRYAVYFSFTEFIWSKNVKLVLENTQNTKRELNAQENMFGGIGTFLSQTLGDGIQQTNSLMRGHQDITEEELMERLEVMGNSEIIRRQHTFLTVHNRNESFWNEQLHTHIMDRRGSRDVLRNFESDCYEKMFVALNLLNFDWISQQDMVTYPKGRKFRHKEKPARPIDSYKEVTIELPKIKGLRFAQKEIARQTPMGIKQHWVAGHNRVYLTKDGPIKKPIQAYLRGDPELGFVHKDYKLTKSAEKL